MDPNAAWRLFREAVEDGDLAVAKWICAALVDWVSRGGFAPADYSTEMFANLLVGIVQPLLKAWENERSSNE